MTTITVELLHGHARAAGFADEALMGGAGPGGEWPLSPARLFAALVSGGGTGKHRTIAGDDSELLAIESAPPPTIHADPLSDVAFTPLNERFVVLDQTATATAKKRGVDPEPSVQNYPFRSSRTDRPGTRLVPKTPRLSYSWPELSLSVGQLESLRRRAARVGYLGAADAPASVFISDDGPPSDLSTWTVDERSEHAVSVPYPGLLAALDGAYEQFLCHAPVSSAQLPRELVRYRSPDDSIADTPSRPIRTWLAFDRAVPAHRVLVVAEALKGLVLDDYDERGTSGEAPAVLTGHVPKGEPQARYWPLTSVGHERSDGRVFGACIELPPDTDPR
ncbi:MAG: type I-U CRISPR-associated protein Cas5/Cas6, partial [Microthrixaceae bacterium]|nr:type I-U CRISPR-associated protein Cas5/Cas6 [Microthrixaceae bacterium]